MLSFSTFLLTFRNNRRHRAQAVDILFRRPHRPWVRTAPASPLEILIQPDRARLVPHMRLDMAVPCPVRQQCAQPALLLHHLGLPPGLQRPPVRRPVDLRPCDHFLAAAAPLPHQLPPPPKPPTKPASSPGTSSPIPAYRTAFSPHPPPSESPALLTCHSLVCS